MLKWLFSRHPVIIVETCEKKKRKQFCKTCYTTNKEKKTSPFFLKDLSLYSLCKKQKELFWKLLVGSFGLKKNKNKAFIYKNLTK